MIFVGETPEDFTCIKHSGLVIKPLRNEVVWQKGVFSLTTNFIAGLLIYESQHIVILLLLPPSTAQSTMVIKSLSPNLLSLYEPLQCPIIHTKKKVLVSHSLYFLFAPLIPGTNQKSAFFPAHSPSFTYISCASLVYVKTGLYCSVSLSNSNNTKHTVVS